MSGKFLRDLDKFLGGFLRKTSNLETDMAGRIMYSMLPSLADPAQVALTGGVVDYKALRTAVAGRKNIIKYGLLAVINELEHGQKPEAKHKVQTLFDRGMIIQAIDLAVENFKDKTLWFPGFGGLAWQRIAETLRQIIRLDHTLDQIKANPDDHDKEQELEVMKDLVVQMNVFDGLAHNNASIMRNLVDLETPLRGPTERKKEYNRIRRLMDAKELESPTEVFRLIRPTLEGSGDIHKFKDWISKMRQHNEYRARDPRTAHKLFIVYLRKELMSSRRYFNEMRDKCKQDILALEKKLTNNTLNIDLLLGTIEYFGVPLEETKVILGEVDECPDGFFEQYPEFMDHRTDIANFILGYVTRGTRITDALYKFYLALPHMEEQVNATQFRSYIGYCKEILSLLNHFSYLLDSI